MQGDGGEGSEMVMLRNAYVQWVEGGRGRAITKRLCLSIHRIKQLDQVRTHLQHPLAPIHTSK